MVFPMIKIASLVMKSAAKPIAGRLKVSASKNPRFKAFSVKFGRLLHSWQNRLQSSVGERLAIAPRALNEEEAVKYGADLISEAFLLATATGLLAVEYYRGKAKDQTKEEALQAKFDRLELAILQQQALLQKLNVHHKGITNDFLLYQKEKPKPPEPGMIMSAITYPYKILQQGFSSKKEETKQPEEQKSKPEEQIPQENPIETLKKTNSYEIEELLEKTKQDLIKKNQKEEQNNS